MSGNGGHTVVEDENGNCRHPYGVGDTCSRCGQKVPETCLHCKGDKGTCPDHPRFCCDCFDLSWFHDIKGCLETLNRRRPVDQPIIPPWPEGGYPE